MGEYERVKRELKYSGNILDFYNDVVRLPDGKLANRDFLKHNGAAAIVAADKDNNILMVKQYREAIDRYTIEIPAGKRENGEDFKVCALRELEEETGYKSKDASPLISLYTTVAFCDERIEIFYTDQLTVSSQKLDEDEFVSVSWYKLDDLVQMIQNGSLNDAKTIAAIMSYKALKNL